MQTIALVTGSHLCHNPRVIKEATALKGAGYNVEVLGGWFDPSLKARDQALIEKLGVRFLPALDLTIKPALRLMLRAQGTLAKLRHRVLGLENNLQLGYFVKSLRRSACSSGADLLLAHSEQGLVAVAAAKRYGKRVGVDMEDWFSEDLLPAARRNRPLKLLRQLERDLLRNGLHTSCPSGAMSEALVSEFQCRAPAVVYNAFHWSDRQALNREIKDRLALSLPSIHWYSQTLGPARGLEDLLEALPQIKYDAEIHLRGKPTARFAGFIEANTPDRWRKRVFIHPLVRNDELLPRIAEHEIGFAGELNYCRNKELTVSNKLLHYLVAGLAVVASDTKGQKEVADLASGAVLLYKSGDPSSLAARINTLLSSRERLLAAKEAALRAARNQFCWEKAAFSLVSSVDHAFAVQSWTKACPKL